MDKKESEEYRFVNEQIKKKPADKRELMLRTIRTAFFGVLFGFLAALSFCLFRPVFEGAFAAREEEQVNLPEPSAEPEPEPVYITETQQMELSDYQVLRSKLYGVGQEANRSVVKVTSVRSLTDWFNAEYEAQGQGAGIIIADTGQRLLIVTEKKLITDASHIRVSFLDGSSADAELAAYDGNTGIAVLGVDQKDLKDQTKQSLQVAELGSSGMVTQGSMVIAVGSPLGEAYSIVTGNVTGTTREVTTADVNYRLITTDIVGNENGSGALINLNGQVVGLIMQGYGNAGSPGTITALGISQLRDLIEGLSNGKSPVYLGLEVASVTDELTEEYGLPSGVCVKNVRMDSPGMEAGIQAGDVIVRIDGAEILTEAQYETALQGARDGQTLEVTVKRMGAGDNYQEVTCRPVLSVLQ